MIKKERIKFSWISFLLVIILFTLAKCIVPVHVHAADVTVYFGAHAVSLDYGPGDYFTDDHGTCKVHYTSSPCKDTYNGIYFGARQCYGYARYIQQKVFGFNEYTNPDKFYEVEGAKVAAGSLTAEKLKAIMTSGKVQPGAHIRTQGSSPHSMIITQITSTGFTIIQCNGRNNNEYSKNYEECRIGTFTYTWDTYMADNYSSRGIAFIKMPYNYTINPSDYSPVLEDDNGYNPSTPYRPGYYRVSTQSGSNLMLRSVPVTGTIRARIPSGTEIAVSEASDNGWGRTSYNGEDGWVSLSYCNWVGDFRTSGSQQDSPRVVISNVDIGVSAGQKNPASNYALGYAKYCQRLVWGYDEGSLLKGKDFVRQTNVGTIDLLKLYSSIGSCAHIRTNDSHSMIVVAADNANVTITDANYAGNNLIRKQTYPWDELWAILHTRFSGISYISYWNATGDDGGDSILYLDAPVVNSSSGVKISGWIASRRAIGYLMGELEGIKQYNFTASLTSDSGVKSYVDSLYGANIYPYNKRFSLTIPSSDLKAYSNYSFKLFGQLLDGTAIETKTCSFTTSKLTSGPGSSGTAASHPHILHVDSPSGSFPGDNNIEISGWIASNKAVSYVMSEIVGVTQVNLTNIVDDDAVRTANLNMYTYNKRFRGAISLSLLQSNTTYTCKTWVGFSDSTVTEVYETTFHVGNITGGGAGNLVKDCDYAIKIDSPAGTFNGYNNVEISGWIVCNQDINHLMVEWTNGSQGGQQNLTGTLVYADDVYQNAIAQYGAGAFDHTLRFHGVIPLTQLQGNSDYTFKVWAGMADGRITDVVTANFHMNEIPTGIKAPVMGFDTPVANGTYSELLDVSGWIVSDSPVMYLQSQLDSGSGTMVKEIQNLSYTKDQGPLINYSTFKYGYRFTGQFRTDSLAGGAYTIRAWCGDDEGNRKEVSRSFKLSDMSSLNISDYYLHLDIPEEGKTYSSNFEITGWIGAYAPITYALFQVDGAYQNSMAIERAPDVEEHLQSMGYQYTYVRRFRGVVEPWRLNAGSTYTIRAWFGLGRTGMTDSNRCKTTFKTASTVIRDTYSIKYDANGGSGAPSSQTKVCGTNLTLSSTVPVKLGYTFKGWSSRQGAVNTVEYLPWSTFTDNAPATLYALWEEGGMIDAEALLEEEAVAISLKGTYRYFAFTPKESARYRFETGGNQDACLVVYTESGSILAAGPDTGGNASVKADLEAGNKYWLRCGIAGNASTGSFTVSVCRAYDVVFDSNSGTGGPEGTYYQYYDEPLILPGEIPEKTLTLTYDPGEGTVSAASLTVPAAFEGWETYHRGEISEYAPGDAYEENKSAVLNAVWAYPCHVVLEEPVQEGKVFAGWISECGELIDENYYVTDDEVVTAAWVDDVVPAESIEISPKALNLALGETAQLSLTVSPRNATVPLVSWISSNPDSVTVSEDGEVRAVGNGAATISAVMPDSSMTPEMTVAAGSLSFTVSYDANGGTNAPSGQALAYGDIYRIPDEIPVYAGYTFMGWATEPISEEALWQPGEFIRVERTMTLYAVWEDIVYAIRYDANGGIGVPDTQYKRYGKTIILSAEQPAHEGCSFAGWSVSASADSVDYHPGDIFADDRDVTLYAVWKDFPTGISLNYTNLTMAVNQTKALRAILSPDGAEGGPVLWTSSNETVVTVNNGNITAAAPGKAQILCMAADNLDLTAACSVTVVSTAPVSSEGEMEAPAIEDRRALPGETVSVNINFRSENAAYAKLLINYDESAMRLDAITASGTHVTAGNKAIVMAVSSGKIPDGTQAVLHFTILENAKSGFYLIDTIVTECYKIDEEDCIQYGAAADLVQVGCQAHSPIMIAPQPAARERDGLGAGWRCGVCGEILASQAIIPKERCLFLPDALREIEEEAFAGTSAMQIVLSGNTITIGDRAFSQCTELALVVIPESVTAIGKDVFAGCSNVVIMTSGGSYAEQYALENRIACYTAG